MATHVRQFTFCEQLWHANVWSCTKEDIQSTWYISIKSLERTTWAKFNRNPLHTFGYEHTWCSIRELKLRLRPCSLSKGVRLFCRRSIISQKTRFSLNMTSANSKNKGFEFELKVSINSGGSGNSDTDGANALRTCPNLLVSTESVLH